MIHWSFTTATVTGNTRFSECVDDIVVTRGAKQRCKVFVLALLCKELSTRNASLLSEGTQMFRRAHGAYEILWNLDRGNRPFCISRVRFMCPKCDRRSCRHDGGKEISPCRSCCRVITQCRVGIVVSHIYSRRSNDS